MLAKKFICGLESSADSNIRNALIIAKNNRYDFIITPLFHPGLDRGAEVFNPNRPLSRSSQSLETSDWTRTVVGKISTNLDVDSPNEIIRKRSERLLEEEINYANHLSLPWIVIPLQSDNCVNLARIVHSHLVSNHELKVWMRVSLENPFEAAAAHRSDAAMEEFDSPWEWWNKFRLLCDGHKRLGVILDMGDNLPTEMEGKRWIAEPIFCIVLSTSSFLTNAKGYPVLSKEYQQFIQKFFSLDCDYAIRGPNRHVSINFYVKYLEYAWNKGRGVNRDDDPLNAGFEDCLQCPLQPLMNNLDAQTYEVFEKDPVKYRVYKEAIFSALIDRVSEEDKTTVVSVLMVMGAGRGPLVACALKAAEESGRLVKVYAVEKNPSAVITLQCRNRSEWGGKVTVLSGDMRQLELEEKADIIISELLGSFGDNELSPECLDGAQKYLKDDGISIPESYTSYVCPVMSQKLHTEARNCPVEPGKPPTSQLETLYVVLQRNKLYLDDYQPLFTFRHPNRQVSETPIDNTRYEIKEFTASTTCVIHGFTGFFDTILYKSHVLSILPDSFSDGMFSWYPIFMPIQRPVRAFAGDTITAHFWRRVSDDHVWYEWTITSPETIPIHNTNGRSSKIGL